MESVASHQDFNLYKHFIAYEAGTSAYLATLIAPDAPEELQPFRDQLCRGWQTQLCTKGINLASSRPAKVSVEYAAIDEKGGQRSLDIVIWWDDWFLALENKIQSSSIQTGQLQDQYNILWNMRDRGNIERNLRIGMIFLTPTDADGRLDFDALQIRDGDFKSHLSWHEVLDWINQISWDASDSSSDDLVAFRNLVTSGSARVLELLTANGPTVPAPIQETYDALKAFMKQVWKKIGTGARSLSFSHSLTHQPWFDKRRSYISLACKLEGIGGRCVLLDVYADPLAGLSQGQLQHRLGIRGKVAFYIEKSAEGSKKKTWSASIQDLSQGSTRRIIERILPEGDGWQKLAWADISAVQNGGDAVKQEFQFDEVRDEEGEALASRVLSFLFAFRSVLYP